MRTNNLFTYGIISDIHGRNSYLTEMLKILKNKVGNLILNGDIGDDKEEIKFVLEECGKSEIKTYVQPGGHESIADYRSSMAQVGIKHPNLIDVTQQRYFHLQGHDLVFLPGSDFLSPTGEYALNASNSEKTGIVYSHFFGRKPGIYNFTNINDLECLVRDVEKTIVFCHVPPRFCLEARVEKIEGGNEELGKMYKKLGVKKAVNGHFHSSSHRAYDLKGEEVDEGVFAEELFWNAGCLAKGLAGILYVKGVKVKYENLRIENC